MISNLFTLIWSRCRSNALLPFNSIDKEECDNADQTTEYYRHEVESNCYTLCAENLPYNKSDCSGYDRNETGVPCCTRDNKANGPAHLIPNANVFIDVIGIPAKEITIAIAQQITLQSLVALTSFIPSS